MNRLTTSILLLLGLASVAATVPFAGSNSVSSPALFGVRGGGLFGGKDDESAAAAPGDGEEKTMYPAMTKEEIEEWLGHIPVFAVTDKKGQGVVLRPDDDTSVFYFFMNPVMANATLAQLKSANEELDLQISAFSLGKIWFKILKSDADAEVKIKSPNADDTEDAEVTKGVQYRLIPDTRDLMGARMLLTMDPSDGEALKAGGTLTPEVAQAAIKKAMTDSPKFNSTYNEIPVFMIQQMRMVKQAPGSDPPSAADELKEADTMLPMYFNLATMVSTWQSFTSQTNDAKDVEPAINLLDLYEIVEKMQEESEVDWRNVILIPPANVAGDSADPSAAAAAATAATPNPAASMQMPGAGQTLGDL